MSIKQQIQTSLAPLQARFDALPERDQKALSTLAVFLIIMALVFGLWWPSHNAKKKAELEYQSAQNTLSWIKANQGMASAAKTSGVNNNGGSVLGVVSSSAAAYGFTLRRFEPEGERVRIWLDGVAFNKVAEWLLALEKQGISASDAQIERQQNTGLVSVRLSLGR